MSWPKTRIEDVAASSKYACVGGPFGSKLTSKDYVTEGVPVIRGANMGARFISNDDFVFVTEGKVNKDLSGNMAHAGDVVFTQRGTLGQVSLVPENAKFDQYVVSQSQMKLTVDKNKADAKFVYYYFSSKETVNKILNYVSSSGVPHINLTVLRNFEIPLPELEQQKEIVNVLAAYDDLIENNKRRIELLEESARQLYKEWFVRLRFPGHEHVEIVDGVPEGWIGLSASEALQVNPRTPVEKGKPITYVPMACLDEKQMTVDSSAFEVRSKHTSVKFQRGDTLFARITPCLENGKTGYVDFLEEGEVGCGSTEFIVLRGNKVSNQFAYLMAREENFRGNAIKSMIGSSGRQRVQPSCFDRYIVPVAPSSILSQFDEAVVPIFDQIHVLNKQNGQLAKARDLLLPKLMSGEIAV